MRRRLASQRLTRATLRTPADVVRWMGAVQSQDLPAALWGVGLRLARGTLAQVERACDRGAILRTHVMRPTWHFVTPDDLAWLLDLTAPRVHAATAYRRRQLELDPATLSGAMKALERALAGGAHLTRERIAEALARAGIIARGDRLGHLMAYAELEQLVVSGARDARHLTYARFDERIPNPRRLGREAALAELARRYFTSHGPATLRDFAWWSGLTVREARRGLESIRPAAASERIGELVFWFVRGTRPARAPAPMAHLLPAYDEYLVAYQDRDALIGPPAGRNLERKRYGPQLAVNGMLAGTWRLRRDASAMVVEVSPRGTPAAGARAAVGRAVSGLGRFLGFPAGLRLQTRRRASPPRQATRKVVHAQREKGDARLHEEVS